MNENTNFQSINGRGGEVLANPVKGTKSIFFFFLMLSTSDGLILLYFSCYTLHVNRLHVIFSLHVNPLIGVHHLIVFETNRKPFS